MDFRTILLCMLLIQVCPLLCICVAKHFPEIASKPGNVVWLNLCHSIDELDKCSFKTERWLEFHLLVEYFVLNDFHMSCHILFLEDSVWINDL